MGIQAGAVLVHDLWPSGTQKSICDERIPAGKRFGQGDGLENYNELPDPQNKSQKNKKI